MKSTLMVHRAIVFLVLCPNPDSFASGVFRINSCCRSPYTVLNSMWQQGEVDLVKLDSSQLQAKTSFLSSERLVDGCPTIGLTIGLKWMNGNFFITWSWNFQSLLTLHLSDVFRSPRKPTLLSYSGCTTFLKKASKVKRSSWLLTGLLNSISRRPYYHHHDSLSSWWKSFGVVGHFHFCTRHVSWLLG